MISLGPWTIHPLTSGTFGLDGGAMFGSVPKALWQRTNPADEANRITMACRHLLIEGLTPAGLPEAGTPRAGGTKRLILVDTGMGHNWTEKQVKIFRIDQAENAVDSALKGIGFSSEQVTDVILTHLHFDHAGGATRVDGSELVPAFPGARYYVQKAQWDLANSPSLKDQASFVPDNFLPLERHGRLELLEGEQEVAPGVAVLVGNGHTDGHQMVKVTGGGQTAVFLGDTVPTATHLALPYIMGYDLRPLQTLEEKAKLLAQAAEEGWWLFFDHDPQLPGVKVVPGEKYVQISERYGQ